MNDLKHRRLIRAVSVTAAVATVLVTGGQSAVASQQIFGGGDCWANVYQYSSYAVVMSGNDSCTTLGARHKWFLKGVTGYTNWNYSDSYYVSSDPAVVLSYAYGRAYD